MCETSEVKSTAPCQAACPAEIDVPRYIRYLKAGKFQQALAVIRERLPFPEICGYACFHPCESKCARQQYDEPVAIRMLKRVAAHNSVELDDSPVPVNTTGKKAAIIGAGPCGLTAAYYLAVMGHNVKVYEALDLPGGMLHYGIPKYRLPRRAVEREIEIITKRGVQIITGIRINSATQLLEDGYDAVLVATGAWRGREINLNVSDNTNILDGVKFLFQVNSGQPPVLKNCKVVVIGGGNTAIDAARSAIRLGANEVVILYRRSRPEMPSQPEEVAEALEEGVKIEFQIAPVAIEDNKVICVRTSHGGRDKDGRSIPILEANSELVVNFDYLIIAAGQTAEAAAVGLPANRNGTVIVQDNTMTTPVNSVFAAGDAVTGPSSIIEAVREGRKASVAIDRYLGGLGIIGSEDVTPDLALTTEPTPPGTNRLEPEKTSMAERISTFNEVEHCFEPEAAVREAERCFGCDQRHYAVELESNLCKGCGYCREICSLLIFQPSDSFNSSGYKSFKSVNDDKCVGCLRCQYICPDFAINVEKTS